MKKTIPKNTTKKVSDDETNLTPEQILRAALPPVNFIPDMTPVFAYAEKFQENVGALSLDNTKQSIVELYARTTPALELSLAVLAESVNLSPTWDDFFKPEPT